MNDPHLVLPNESGQTTEKLFGEIAGTLLVLGGIFLSTTLLAGEDARRIVGQFGAQIAFVLQFTFGDRICHAIPAIPIAMGVLAFRSGRLSWSGSRALGVFLLVVASCGLLAVGSADNPAERAESFRHAGALGAYLVEWEGLQMVGQFGTVGAVMILSGMALIGAVLSTRIGISTGGRMLANQLAQALPTNTVEFDASGAPVPVRRPAPVTESRFFRFFRPRLRESAAILGPDISDADMSWYEPLDRDAANAARAINNVLIDDVLSPPPAAAPPAPTAPIAEHPLAPESSPEVDLAALVAAPATPPVILGNEVELVKHEITFEEAPSIPIMSGNPANAALAGESVEEEPAAAPAALGQGLAKLFPERYPKPAAEPSEEEIRDAAEERMLNRAAVAEEPHADDPLFDENHDAKPHGPKGAPKKAVVQEPTRAEFKSYMLPNVELLDAPPQVDHRMPREELLKMSETLQQTLADFGISGLVTNVLQGPVVTRFELRPAAGVKISRIVGLEHDIAMAMKAVSVRIMAPIPGKDAVGIEIPNRHRAGVYLKELLSVDEFWDHPSPLAFALGKTIEGTPYYCDLKKMPHLLIAGATGAGKSVCLNTIIASFLYRQRPDRVRLIMVDPKRVELSVYGDIPHLLAPVVCEPKRAAAALAWAVEEMETRYKKLVEFGVRNIDGYNAIAAAPHKFPKAAGRPISHMPHMVVIVDELADLMIIAKAEVEESIQRLAQMSRAVGIHLILATQRPSVNVITGIIKANFPSRIAFQVSQKVDSRTILDANGAEALLGRGDMLFSPGGAPKPIRVQGCFVSDEEVERLANYVREQSPPVYEVEEFEPVLSEKEQRELARLMGNPESMEDLDMLAPSRGTNKVMGKVTAGMFVPHGGGSAQAGEEEIDEALVRAAARLILESRKASVSLVQRRLKVGFARAGRLMDMLEEMGIVGKFQGSKPRDIIVDCDAALAELDRIEGGKPSLAPETEEEEEEE